MDNVVNREYLRSLFSPGLTFAYKVTKNRDRYLAILTFISPSLSALTVCESFPSYELAQRWIAAGADAADSVALSSGGLCNTATSSPAGEFLEEKHVFFPFVRSGEF